jgi:hypothetical protein
MTTYISSARNTSGFERIQVDPPDNSRHDVISQNFCDKTTWYMKSVRVEGENLTDSGDHTTYNSGTVRSWVDVTHGKLTGEDLIKNAYVPKVYIDSVEKTENSPGTTDGDFSIDYDNSSVTFNVALQGTEVVTCDYSYANGSEWIVSPIAGKSFTLTHVEVQFSEDVQPNDTVIFQVYGYVDVFAPHLTPDPYPSGTKIPIGNPGVYKTMQDFINAAEGAYPSIPAFSSGWRGIPSPVHIFRWAYKERGTTKLLYKHGMEIRISLENDIVFGGSAGIATFYGISEEE